MEIAAADLANIFKKLAQQESRLDDESQLDAFIFFTHMHRRWIQTRLTCNALCICKFARFLEDVSLLLFSPILGLSLKAYLSLFSNAAHGTIPKRYASWTDIGSVEFSLNPI